MYRTDDMVSYFLCRPEGGNLSISHDGPWRIVGVVVPISQSRCMTNCVEGILVFFFVGNWRKLRHMYMLRIPLLYLTPSCPAQLGLPGPFRTAFTATFTAEMIIL